MLDINTTYLGDCLEIMKDIDAASIDAIIADLPYNITACAWDTIIPFEPLWAQYERIIKDDGAIVLFGSQPFTSKLINSNINLFRYELIWQKDIATGFLDAKRKPLKIHENICVFSKRRTIYNPQMTKGKPYKAKRGLADALSITKDKKIAGWVTINEGVRYPVSVQKFNTEKGLHPTQKPIKLLEWLIKTYTMEGNIILDNTAGSGSLGIACLNTKRNYILIEKDEAYYSIIKDRINNYNKPHKVVLKESKVNLFKNFFENKEATEKFSKKEQLDWCK